MCVALVLIFNSFYKFYDRSLELCEHVTAACLIFVTISIIFLPVLLTVANQTNVSFLSNESGPLLCACLKILFMYLGSFYANYSVQSSVF